MFFIYFKNKNFEKIEKIIISTEITNLLRKIIINISYLNLIVNQKQKKYCN